MLLLEFRFWICATQMGNQMTNPERRLMASGIISGSNDSMANPQSSHNIMMLVLLHTQF